MTGIRIKRNNRFWSLHTHSKFSENDALPTVTEIVDMAQELGYRGLALTDHGNMAGSVQLYQECMKRGIKPFPGSEMYLVLDRNEKRPKRFHVGLVAYTTEGYRNLIHISTTSHRNFKYKPLIDLGDMATFAAEGRTQGIALTTGCFFGLVQQTLITEGYDAAKQVVAMYSQWFDTYVEIQNHCIDHGEDVLSEDEISSSLCNIADELNLPVVLTQDSHYVRKGDRPLHEALKRLVAFGPEVDDAVFPGDGFHMADDRWMALHHSPEVLARGMAGLDLLLDKWSMAVPEMDTYDYRVPELGDLAWVKKRVVRRATELGLATNKRYFEQIMLEFEIIDYAHMWGYLAFVALVCDHMREVEMFHQIRGSAGGSLICYLLQIAEHDPLKWKLRMDRFLSKDRTKPPDIDIDVESNRRQELIEWLGDTFACQQIGTWRAYSIDGDTEDGKGSLRVRYMSRARAAGVEIDWKNVPAEDRHMMSTISSWELFSGYGKHAAGLLVTTNRSELESQVPLMWIASSKTMVTQYDGKDVEKLGLVKLDVLGVKNLDVLRQTMINLGRNPYDGMGWIPLSDKPTFTAISKGNVDGVFQLEGKTSRREVTKLKPTKIADVIAAMALFRPGVMVSGSLRVFYDRRQKLEQVPERHALLDTATKETQGILLYQDSVIEVLRGLGMNADDLTKMLKAVKMSNKNVAEARRVMEHYKPMVMDLCAQLGIPTVDSEWLWEGIEGFAEYSFNRAHATIYGITAYRCAYLQTKYPLEFYAALLAVAAGGDKEKPYAAAARKAGLRLLNPDVNYSKATYAVDPQRRGIRKGLTAIHGIGPAVGKEVETKQPFTDMDDFAQRVAASKVSGVNDYLNDGTFKVGKLQILHEARALNSILKDKVL